jgi:protein-disulfide isomerase
MISKASRLIILCMPLVALYLWPGAPSAREPEAPFPSFGKGPVEVRLYTDYFCPPCRALEPEVEPILKNLLNKKAIRLTLVDVPHNQNSPIYASYFLYSLAKNPDVEHAAHVRNILFDEAAKKDSGNRDHLESLFKSKGIAYEIRDNRPVFSRYNALIKEDKINATPTCVIIRTGKKEKFTGGPDIVKALKKLP